MYIALFLGILSIYDGIFEKLCSNEIKTKGRRFSLIVYV